MADIIQWNCRGIRSKSENLKVLCREMNPKVICLQETKLGESDFNAGMNYCVYKSPPLVSERAKGGTALIVSKNIQHEIVNINTSLQATAVRVLFDKLITVCSLYLPPDLCFNTADLQNLITQLPSPFLLLGDFNSHNPLWGGTTLDGKGKTIEDLICNNQISLFNDGSFTYHDIFNDSYSAIDLSIGSSSIFLDFTWSVDEFLNGSDHYPIYLKCVHNTPLSSTPKWKFEKANWEKFSKDINLDKEFENFPDHITAYDYFTKSILDSAEANIPKTKNLPHRPAVPWWDENCSKLRRSTRKFYRRYKKNASPETKNAYQQAVAKQRKHFKAAKRTSWICYINGINSKTPARFVWKKIKKLNGKYVPAPLPAIKVGDQLITEPAEVSEKLAEHFASISRSKKCPIKEKSKLHNDISVRLKTGRFESYNIRFSLKELKEALSNTESTAPGEDNIAYEMIKHLNEEGKIFLLKIINKIWETGVLPKDWKVSLIIPIKKLIKMLMKLLVIDLLH